MIDGRELLVRATRRTVIAAAWLNIIAASLVLLDLPWPRLGALADLAPIWFAASIAVLAIAALVRAPRLALAGALLGALTPAFLMAPELVAAARPPPRAPANAPELTLLTINLWSANQHIAAVDDLIRAENPDIIVAQEAWAPWKEYFESLAPEYRVQAGCRYDSDCNLVVLSRLRLIGVVAAPDNGIAAVRLELPARFGAGTVDVLGVHLSRPASRSAERRQRAQVRAISENLAPSLLVAGDFNATPWSRLRDLDRALPATRRTRAMFTWPTPARTFTPLRLRAPAIAAIDHVYASDDWRTVELRRGPNIGSDHYPIIALLALDRAPGKESAS